MALNRGQIFTFSRVVKGPVLFEFIFDLTDNIHGSYIHSLNVEWFKPPSVIDRTSFAIDIGEGTSPPYLILMTHQSYYFDKPGKQMSHNIRYGEKEFFITPGKGIYLSIIGQTTVAVTAIIKSM